MKTSLGAAFPSRCWSGTLFLSVLILPACAGGGGGGGNGGFGGGGPRTAETAVMLTADSRHVIAAADDGTGTTVALSAPAMTQVTRFAVSPDGGAVAYVADCDQVDVYGLYVREIAGSAPMRVSQLQNAFDDVFDFAWAPDSQSLVYRADAQFDDRMELFRVGRTGTDHYRVQRGVAVNEDVVEYGWSPDSHRVYTVLATSGTRTEVRLHDANTGIESSSTVHTLAAGREVHNITFSPDSQWITLRTDSFAADGQFEVFRRRTDLSTGLLRSNGAVGSGVQISSFQWSPDSLWLAETVVAFPSGLKIGVNTYQVATDASRRVFDGTFQRLLWSPTEPKLAVGANYDPVTDTSNGVLQLLLHDPNADTTIVVNGAVASGEFLPGDRFMWSPDGLRIAYVTSSGFLLDHLEIVQPGSSLPAVRCIDLADLEVLEPVWSPDSTRLGVLQRDQTQAFHPGEWHVIGLDGRSKFRSGTFLSFQTGMELRWSSDSARATYSVDAAAGGPNRVRSVEADGSTDVELAGVDVAWFENAKASLPKP